ncbi:uncharacterized protein EI90DRAFT_3081590 [Cantharellus anzutake]|uniref:uncharacterized protein n=1 Tax=Cantharellus anzutake TaxID=1750568 RepID=UPI0019051381|nr:uncharacterized protein EI90DRAFT_3081590 [Cantharellus anzutake]KAF8319828.1 hypothetical protein EI90DRAFT_3081590 [Cantharellus anzutake]
MTIYSRLTLLAILGCHLVSAQTFTAPVPSYTATYLPYDTPQKSENGQYGTNQCGTVSSQNSMCQNCYVSAVDDFCIWAPPNNTSPYGNSSIGNTERLEVAWCLRSGYGTRLLPSGAITGAHFIETPNYIQISGTGDLTKVNVPANDTGGELDPHGADGLGNPIGGLVFGYGNDRLLRQYHEWTNFIDGPQFFCFRVCIDQPGSTQYCEHIYDVLGCNWNMPGNYSDGFSSCQGDSTLPMGIYVDNGVTTTFHQGDPVTPSAHPPGASSSCTYYATLSNYNSPAPSFTGSLSNSVITITSSAAGRGGSTGTGTSTSTTKSKPSGGATSLTFGTSGSLMTFVGTGVLLGASIVFVVL